MYLAPAEAVLAEQSTGIATMRAHSRHRRRGCKKRGSCFVGEEHSREKKRAIAQAA
jgi:hypothetical protein